MKIGDAYKSLINEDKKHDYGCVMLFLEAPKEFWDKICGEIEDTDIYKVEGDSGYGIQRAKESHITILYGLHSDISDDEIEARIDKMVAPEVTLKDITLFENEDFDVVKFEVEGEDLHKMNKMFSELPHTTSYPDYEPHCTISYVKAGTGKKYKRTLSKDESLTLKPTKIVYSKTDGSKKEYKFT